MLPTIELGNQIVLASIFRDRATLEPADPSNVMVEVLSPDGDVTSLDTFNPEVGVYKALFTPAVAGVWTVRWSGTGVVVAASEEEFEVRASAFVRS